MNVSNSSGLDGLVAQRAANAIENGRQAKLENLAGQGREVEAIKEFESLFASMLVKEMRQTIEGGLFGDGPGADTYGQWFDTEMGNAIAKDNGLGLASVLRVQFGVDQAAKEARESMDNASIQVPQDATGVPVEARRIAVPPTETQKPVVIPTAAPLPMARANEGIDIAPEVQS